MNARKYKSYSDISVVISGGCMAGISAVAAREIVKTAFL
jgi:hypothetical protein